MKFSLDIICWNEATLIKDVLEYYRKHVDYICVHDNHSTDGSLEIARNLADDVMTFGQPNMLDDREYLKIKNAPRGGYNLNIKCDMDEVLWHKDGLRTAMERACDKGATALTVQGWNIYSDEKVSQFGLEAITNGFYDKSFSKPVAWNPWTLRPNYSFGCHEWNPKGSPVWSKEVFYLRHYRCTGGVQAMIDRHALYAARMCEYNKAKGLGVHYLRTAAQIRQEWEANIKKATPWRI